VRGSYRFLEYCIDRILFRKDVSRVRDFMTPILEYEEAKVMRAKTCPWCGRTFKGLRYLKSHLKRSPMCSTQYKAFMRRVVNDYREFRAAVRQDRVRYGFVFQVNGRAVKVRSVSIAFRVWKGWVDPQSLLDSVQGGGDADG